MKKMLYIAGLALALGQLTTAQEAVLLVDEQPASGEETDSRQMWQDFLQTSSEMWFLLSGIGSQEDADKAASRFRELVQTTYELDNKLSSMPLISPDAECVGMMDGVQMRILETLDEMHVEFVSLCRANCYGSEALRKAFREAVRMGMFAEEDLALMKQPGAPLTDVESQAEIVRILRLQGPDRAVLELLLTVRDEKTASNAVVALMHLSQDFAALQPAQLRINRDFSPTMAGTAHEAMAAIEPVLWAIRSEIVRIAALPGYEAETYDSFSDALDRVFEGLESTHCVLFNSVFDASFRADLESALQENNLSSQ